MNSWFIAANLIRRTIGNVKGFLLFILMPAVIVSTMTGLVSSSGDGKSAVGYADLDGSELSRYVLRALEQTGRYELVQAETDREAADMAADRDVSASFVIPAGFEAGWLAGQKPELVLIRLAVDEASVMLELDLDGIARNVVDAAAAAEQAGSGDVRRDALAVLDRHLQGLVGSVKMSETRDNSWNYLGIGFTLMFLMILINQSVSVIAEDRRNQTMARVYAAPVQSWHIAVGNFFGSVFIGTLQVLGTSALSHLVFGYDYGVPVWMELVVMECFILASLGIASAVAGFIRTTNQLNIINNLIMTPTCMLGGCFWPIEFMPSFMQKLANFVPQKWAIEAINLGADGAAPAELALPLGILLLFAAVLLGFGTAVLRPAK
ncbi:MAG: ABC transporter permease [Thermobacillus sp.]|uniref:Drug ABC transporter, ATP-binding/permease protein n=1 Tax=Thermobacillus xylanilyticus TaxID=76633 RepID=A0ABN7RKF6_THEXY|nr:MULTISPECIES: ABC transporter permease [Thermobacillus]REK56022.1 MAG: ABC transporter permease [Thermobacillus sp.]CAG5079928.1 Drug ABC transporter, ATP-binding/permease protein [Thermobacillus xylanilyticus]